MSQFDRQRIKAQSNHRLGTTKPDQAMTVSFRPENVVQSDEQALGNQAMQRFAESCPLRLPSASICPFGGVCHTCPARAQTKLKISQPADKYEQEADHVAKQLMSMPDMENGVHLPTYDQSREIYLQRSCSKCEEELFGLFINKEEHTLQSDTIHGQIPEIPPYLAIRVNTIRGNGQPLPESERAFFEQRFGYDFSQVRVHTGDQAARTANAINARAFTIGSDIMFQRGEYKPDTVEGKKLLAHELTHVIQQGAGKPTLDFKLSFTSIQTLPMTTLNDKFESEAENAAYVLTRGGLLHEKNFLRMDRKTIALSGGGCTSQKVGYWVAVGAAAAACGLGILTIETVVGGILFGAACLLAIGSWISAALALKECLESDPDADRREIERLAERIRQLEEIMRRSQETKRGRATE